MWVDAPKDAVKVLVLTGNSTHPTWSQTPVYTNTATYEYHTLRSVKEVGKRVIATRTHQGHMHSRNFKERRCFVDRIRRDLKLRTLPPFE